MQEAIPSFPTSFFSAFPVSFSLPQFLYPIFFFEFQFVSVVATATLGASLGSPARTQQVMLVAALHIFYTGALNRRSVC